MKSKVSSLDIIERVSRVPRSLSNFSVSYSILIIMVNNERTNLKPFDDSSVLLLVNMKDTLFTEKSDAQLITEAKNGILTSFEVLVKRYEDRLLGYSYKRLLDSDVASDVTQETFIRIFKNIHSFDISKPFAPWMYTIAKNLSLDIIRKGKHVAMLEWEVEDSKESILTRIIKAEQVTALWRAIKTLPEKYRQPLVGYYFADLSIRELANNFNMPENTIKTRLKRAKSYLRTELGRIGYG